MRLSVFGLGYVGCVSSACFSHDGHEVVGVDTNALKVQIINEGRSPVVEPGVDDLMGAAIKEKRLRATTDAADAVHHSDLSLVCVGTPGQANGSLDLTYVKGACKQIGIALETKRRFHVVAIRSTMLPGTIHDTVVPTLEVYSGKKHGRDFAVAINPEFLREGTAIADFHHPPFTLIGADDGESASMLERMYSHLDAPVVTIGVREAEMVKYVCNCFHGLKVAFANEVGALCKAFGIDSHRVMEVFCKDTKLNLSPYYLKPGFAFGGSCLPKDLRALAYQAKTADVDVALLNAVLSSNRRHIERGVEMVLRTGKKRIGVLGLSFKAGTDDLRESPMVSLIETLIGKGLQVLIFDREVELARLFGANKDYIEQEIPHISSLMRRRLDEVIEQSEVIVLTKRSDEYRAVLEQATHPPPIIDLARVMDGRRSDGGYEGIGW
ncbi:MAG TPA: UDP-glucose/GDP-mannose dehydrogenase family protein [Nitrospira sp.]|jgi:GDP-mannose 6-dehydrogenase|nr:UDP-glucose/GDP-mannose dehydrogenase family protein [Nitrospira sp.]